MPGVAEDAYEDELRQPSGLFANKPTKETPEDQLSYAEQLYLKDKLSKAGRQFRRLVRFWPASNEAPQAQYALARILQEKGKLQQAFDEYLYLMDQYAGSFPHEQVLDQMYKVALQFKEKRKGKFLILPGFRAPERAVPMLQEIIKYGPRWEKAPEAQYLIGQIYDENRNYEDAILAYSELMHRYPESPFAERAAFGKGYDLYLLARESPNDKSLSDAAWSTLTYFLSTFPHSEMAGQAKEYRDTLYRWRSKSLYDQAVFYDKIAKNKEAALQAYERFTEQFPHSGWTTLAEIRIQELKKQLEKTDEK